MNTKFNEENNISANLSKEDKKKYSELVDPHFNPNASTTNFIKLIFLEALTVREEVYARQVIEFFNSKFSNTGFMALSNGSLYPIIKTLEKEGIVKHSSDGLYNSKNYKITKKGISYYKELKKALEKKVKDASEFYTEFYNFMYK